MPPDACRKILLSDRQDALGPTSEGRLHMGARLFVPAALLAASLSGAADLAEFALVGFSRDGSHVAWEEYGVQDGSGFPWAGLVVVEAASGETVLADTLLLNLYSSGYPERWEEELDLVGLLRDSVRTLLAPALDSLGIEEGRTGVALLTRLPTDASHYRTTEFVRQWWGPGYARGSRYMLELECDTLGREMMYNAPLVSLRLVLRAAGRELVLADDGGDGAPMAYWYRIRGVHMYGDSTLAVALSKGLPGFEGPDTRWRVVARVLPEELRP